MPLSDWTEVIRPKVQGTINLHNLLSKTELDFFILLSSASGIIGNRGQAAYAAASTFLDAFALYRRKSNLPAMSLDLGVIRGVGYVAENRHLISQLDQISFDHMSEDEMLALIKVAIDEQMKPIHTHQLTAGLGLVRKDGNINSTDQLPYWADDPKFSHLRTQALFYSSSSSSSQLCSNQAGPPIRQQLREASTLETATELIADQIAKKVAAVLGMAEADIKVEESLSTYGVDSLAAVELRNWVRQEMESTVRLFELLADVPIRDLAAKIARKSKLVSAEVKER
jgi:acyl carrier protein